MKNITLEEFKEFIGRTFETTILACFPTQTPISVELDIIEDRDMMYDHDLFARIVVYEDGGMVTHSKFMRVKNFFTAAIIVGVASNGWPDEHKLSKEDKEIVEKLNVWGEGVLAYLALQRLRAKVVAEINAGESGLAQYILHGGNLVSAFIDSFLDIFGRA